MHYTVNIQMVMMMNQNYNNILPPQAVTTPCKSLINTSLNFVSYLATSIYIMQL